MGHEDTSKYVYDETVIDDKNMNFVEKKILEDKLFR